MPYFFLGDDAFALRVYMMKPYNRQDEEDPRIRVANYRISRGRRVVENGFGILANRWRCFLRPLEQKPDNVRTMAEAAVVLHNLLRIRHPGGDLGDHDEPNRPDVDGAWRRNAQPLMPEIPQPLAGREGDPEGSVPWQEDRAAIAYRQRVRRN